MKINILLCDRFPGLLPEYIPSYDWMFTRLFDSLGRGIEYKVFNTMDGEFPLISGSGNPTNADIHLITGCNLSAYDKVPWIERLLEWIRKAHEVKMRMVGVCFGHQAIAQALGGKVEHSPKGWGVGLRESKAMGEALQHFPGGIIRLLYNHHDQVTGLPRGAQLLSTSEFCPNEAFSLADNVISFQGHPEYLPEYAVHLLTDFSEGEPPEVVSRALSSIGQHRHDGRKIAEWIVERWS